MKNALLGLATLALYLLHQDVWFWRSARPLLLRLPAGRARLPRRSTAWLASLLMLLLVRHAWPAQLEREADTRDERHRRP